MELRKRILALATLVLAACCAPLAVVNAAGTAKPDGFTALLEAHAERDKAAAQKEPGEPQLAPKATPVSDRGRLVSMPAPMWSVIRAYYGPDGDLRWGCSIEPRPLDEDRFTNRIPY